MRTQASTQRLVLRLEISTKVVRKTHANESPRFRIISVAITSSVSQEAYSKAMGKALAEKFMEDKMSLILFMAGMCSEGPENNGCVNWIVESCKRNKF